LTGGGTRRLPLKAATVARGVAAAGDVAAELGETVVVSATITSQSSSVEPDEPDRTSIGEDATRCQCAAPEALKP
jgi:hypothetical protein